VNINTLFGLRETRRKERGRRERLQNILFSAVWFDIKKERKESFRVGPTYKPIPPKMDGKLMKTIFLDEMTQISIKGKKITTIFDYIFY
jgi:hypothetical protein